MKIDTIAADFIHYLWAAAYAADPFSIRVGIPFINISISSDCTGSFVRGSVITGSDARDFDITGF